MLKLIKSLFCKSIEQQIVQIEIELAGKKEELLFINKFMREYGMGSNAMVYDARKLPKDIAQLQMKLEFLQRKLNK